MFLLQLLKHYKRELTVTTFLCLLLFVLNTPAFIFTFQNFFIIAGLGLLLLTVWFIIVYWLYANKKVKKYGEVLLRVRLEEKFIKFFVLPCLFYIAVVLTVFFNKSVNLNTFIILSFFLVCFTLLIHIRSSYEKFHYISSLTKIVYDAVIIMLFFLLMLSASSFGFTGIYGIVFAVGLTMLLLLYKLILNDQLCVQGYLLILISTFLILIVGYLALGMNIFTFSAVTTVAFYLVVSMWTIRLEGYTKWVDYFVPILYAAMILILIFSL
jgi:hypothetical protein